MILVAFIFLTLVQLSKGQSYKGKNELLTSDDAMDTTPLNHMYLIGYYCQRQDFFSKKNNEDNTEMNSIEMEECDD